MPRSPAAHVLIHGAPSALRDPLRASSPSPATATCCASTCPPTRSKRAIEPGLLEALGLPADTPTFLGRSGNGSAIVLLADEAAVRAVAPDFAALRTIDRLVIVTAPGDDTAVTSRVFAAYHGIDEDPVTGAAHAALVPFWAERLGRDPLHRLPGEQARRPHRLRAEARTGSSSAASASP